MGNIWSKIRIIWEDKNLRKRILFVLFSLVIFRLLAAIPIPGIDATKLSQFLSNNQFFGILNVFSGGGLSKLSIIMLGVGPYITSSIIMQLLTIMVPRLKALYQEEGDLGKQKFTQYSRIITIPIALIQGFGLLILLQRQGVLGSLGFFSLVSNLIVVVAGSMLLMWLGELISEYGISNGVSLIIFSGIVASLPTQVSQMLFTFDVSQIPLYIGLLSVSILIIAGVVFITEAERPIPVTYAKRVRGMKVYGGVSTYIPLRINQAGVIPIIFALSILLFPQMIGTFLSGLTNTTLQHIGGAMNAFVQNQLFYGLLHDFGYSLHLLLHGCNF